MKNHEQLKTDKSKIAKVQNLLAILILVTGLLLVVMKLSADSEPGAIPLLLILVGTGWYTLKRFQLRSQGRNARTH
jgi:flagellar biogenesis protein FliO